MNTESRREFEEWATSKGYWTERHDCNDGSFYYECPNTEARWEAWQAARERQTRPMQDACELIADIMRDEVNIVDECEKSLRAYAPQLLFSPNPPTSEKI